MHFSGATNKKSQKIMFNQKVILGATQTAVEIFLLQYLNLVYEIYSCGF